jgi:alpha-beta hydrolase superfamily lysophospholipase
MLRDSAATSPHRMRHVMKFLLIGILILVSLAAGAGRLLGSGVLHPVRKPLTDSQIAFADAAFSRVNAHREDFDVHAADGVLLRGWKVRAAKPNGAWVLLFHGVSDNRTGTVGYAEFLLHSGYNVVMMDARAHGASEGTMATYGWLERNDTREIVDALESSEKVSHLYALGESMGGSIALQSAAIEPRIEGVVAESAFSNLREVSYDYAGLHLGAWLGKTLFRPASMVAMRSVEKEGGFRVADVSAERAVVARPVPVFLICDGRDHTIPCRHSKRIYKSAAGPKQLWRVPGAGHTGAFGTAPGEFTSRVLKFFQRLSGGV